MKRINYLLPGLMLSIFIAGLLIWNSSAVNVVAQKDANESSLGAVTEYSARDEFALTQGGTTGVWNYGFSNSATDNAFTQHTLTRSTSLCGGNNSFEEWYRLGESFDLPSIRRNVGTTPCFNIPPETLILHPSGSGRRAVLRWTAPAAGTYLLNGLFNGLDNTTTDVKILKNAATAGEAVLFSGNIVGFNAQQPFNFTVTAAMGDTIDFSVGFGTNGSAADSTGLAVTVGQPVTACQTAPANLQVNVPAENSPTDVQSLNTNASLVGDATYTNTGKVGRAFSFDGNGDYVRIEDHPAQKPVNQLTLEGWFKLNNTSGFQFLASKSLRGTNTRSYALWIGGGALHVEYRSTSGSVFYNTGIAPPVNAFTHYAMVINTDDAGATANTIKLFANGVEIYSNTANDPVFYDGINNANVPLPFVIGGGFDGSNIPSYFFNGQADEVSVYGRALSQTEIFNLVKQGSFGKCPPAACVQSPSGLVSWFAGEQNALDSRSNNHGNFENGPSYVAGKVGQAFSFNGSTQRVALGNPTELQLQEFTIDAWVKRDSATIVSNNGAGPTQLAAFVAYGNNGYGFGIYPDGTILLTKVGVSGTDSLGAKITDTDWHHVAVTKSGGNVTFYVDGVAASGTAGPYDPGFTFGSNVFIGYFGSGGGEFLGKMDEVGIFNRELTANEVQSIYTAGQSGKCKPSPLNPATNQVTWFTADGDTRDFTGLNPNGILRGNANYKVGKVGQSFNFDGNGDYVEVADDADHKPTNQLTLEGWFKPNTLNGIQFLASKPFSGNGSIRSYALWSGPTLHIEYLSTSGSVLYNTGITPQNNVWTHYAMVINTDDTGATANTIKLYLNGAEVFTNTANNPIVYGAAIPFLIGAGADSLNNPTFFFNGQADEVSLFNRALSASEIAAVYNAGTAGKLKSAAVNFIPPTVSKNSTRGNSESILLLQPATVQISDTTVTFANVTGNGTVSAYGIDTAFLPSLPSSVTFTGLAYDISTNAGYQQGTADDVQVCFNVPALSGLMFPNLRILHLEGGVWMNRTAITSTSPNLCSDNLSSLSPFAIVQALAPTAAAVTLSGKVTDASGGGLSSVNVTMTDSQGRSFAGRTNTFGRYRFDGVSSGEIYTVSVSSKRYNFAVSAQAVNVQEAVDDVDFIANETSNLNVEREVERK